MRAPASSPSRQRPSWRADQRFHRKTKRQEATTLLRGAMGFWSFLRRNKGAAVPGDAAVGDVPQPQGARGGEGDEDPVTRDIGKLTRAGLPGGPTADEAMVLFAMLRATPDEARAVEELVRTTQERRLPETLLLALGRALVDRGELEIAERALAGATSS